MLRKAGIPLVVLVVLTLLAAGCPATLAPTYDKTLSEGLRSANSGIMELFAAASGGTTKESFAERKDAYNNLIGRMDALALQARARPMPSNAVTKKVNEFLSSRGVAALAEDEAPSAGAIDKISATLTKMRDTDKKQGLTAVEVTAFKQQVAIYLDQAITYESFLER